MELTKKEWQCLELLLPELPTRRRGRPWHGNREVLDVILWILRTSAPWRELPEKYPPYQTCHHRFQQWSGDGTLRKVLTALADKLEKRRQLNMSECCIDRKLVVAKKGVNVSARRNAVTGRS